MAALAGKLGRLVLAAALLAGWQAALLHPIEHVDEHGAFVHATGSHGGHGHGHEHDHDHDHDHEGGEATALCDAIAAVAVVLGGGAAAALPAAVDAAAVPQGRAAGALGAPRLAYRSHAPPLHS